MKARPEIPPAVSARQHEASDPEVSAWASANAGSGKTHVLTQRVIKLLLGGEDPAQNPLHHLHQGRGRNDGDARVQYACRMDRL